jgi:hypothetical protein
MGHTAPGGGGTTEAGSLTVHGTDSLWFSPGNLLLEPWYRHSLSALLHHVPSGATQHSTAGKHSSGWVGCLNSSGLELSPTCEVFQSIP